MSRVSYSRVINHVKPPTDVSEHQPLANLRSSQVVAENRTAITKKDAIRLSSSVKALRTVIVMEDYEETLRDIEATFGMVPGFMRALPQDVLMHDWPLWKRYSLGESAIPSKYRELGGLAVAANIKCPYCQLMHTAMAQFHGATQEELAEVYYLASLTARWSAMIHAQNYDWETFVKEAEQMGEGLQKRAQK